MKVDVSGCILLIDKDVDNKHCTKLLKVVLRRKNYFSFGDILFQISLMLCMKCMMHIFPKHEQT